MKQKYTNP